MYSFLQSFAGREAKNFNAATYDCLLRTEALIRRARLWPKWLGYQLRRTRESYWPAYRSATSRKPWHRVLPELIGQLLRWRCLPFHYFRYALYRNALSQTDINEFLPETVMYYRLLPKINSACLLLDDKIVAKEILTAHSIEVPATVLWTAMGGIWVPGGGQITSDSQLRSVYREAFDACVLKPATFGSGGRTISIFHRHGDTYVGSTDGTVLDTAFLQSLKGKWILEAHVPQHTATHELHPPSLNTFRVVTSFVDGLGVEVLYCILKCGVNGRQTDNAHTDGVYVGVDICTGRLAPQAFDENLGCHATHPTTNLRFAGRRIEQIKAIIDIARRAAGLVPNMGLVGWDIALRNDGRPVVIEGNSSPGLTIIQRTSGGMAPTIYKRWARC